MDVDVKDNTVDVKCVGVANCFNNKGGILTFDHTLNGLEIITIKSVLNNWDPRINALCNFALINVLSAQSCKNY